MSVRDLRTDLQDRQLLALISACINKEAIMFLQYLCNNGMSQINLINIADRAIFLLVPDS